MEISEIFRNMISMLDSVQLVNITPMSRTGLWYANNELVTGAFVNQLSYLGGRLTL